MLKFFKTFVLVAFLACSFSISAQHHLSIDSLMSLSSFYSDLSNRSRQENMLAVKDLGLSDEMLADFLELEGDDIFQIPDSVEGWDIWDQANFYFGYYFASWLTHPELTKSKLLEIAKEEDFWVVVSSDEKIFNLIMEENHGGTYRSNISHIIVANSETDLEVYLDDMWEEEMDFNTRPNPFYPDGYGSIDLLETDSANLYVFKGYVRGCSYCFGNYLELYELKPSGFKLRFSIETMSRNWDETISFLHQDSLLTVAYYLDDLTSECFCDEENFEDLLGPDSLPRAFDADSFDSELMMDIFCECNYRFNGYTFVPVHGKIYRKEWEEED